MVARTQLARDVEHEHLLSACEHHTDAGVRERAAFIRDYLARRAREAHA